MFNKMSIYVTEAYNRTVFQTANIEEIRPKLTELLESYKDEEGLFMDPDFGPTESDPSGEVSIFYPADEENEMQGDASVGQFNNIAGLNIDMLAWHRPRDFCKDPHNVRFVRHSDDEEESEEEEIDIEEQIEMEEHKRQTKGWDRGKLAAEIQRKQTVHEKHALGGASSLDVMQGNLGDCWFISALALVALRTDLFAQLVCDEQFKECYSKGLYVFRMFKNSQMHFVVIDDKVPCMERSNGQCIPAFARCRNPNEFWVSLVEKAYAKLNSRYINLTSGFIDEALQDLTGLAPEMIRFNHEVEKPTLWKTMRKLFKTDSLVGASLNFLGRRDVPEDMKRELQTEARHHGIQYGHAYGILDIREVPDLEDPNLKHSLVRLKNPWGKENNLEWNGEWSDGDSRWTKEMMEAYNEAGKNKESKLDAEELVHKWLHNDNIFIMNFEDFTTYFNQIMLVRDFPDEWSGIRYMTKWAPGYGIPPKGKNWTKNPQFVFLIKKRTAVSIRLQQPDPRSFVDNRPPFKKSIILLCVFKMELSEKTVTMFSTEKIALQSQGADSRSVTASGELKPGKYSIVLLNASEGINMEAYLSIYFDCPKQDIQFENKDWMIILEEEENLEHSHHKHRHFIPNTLQDSVHVSKKPLSSTVERVKEEDDSQNKIPDALQMELEFEREMAQLLGLNYQDYKKFYKMSAADKEELIQKQRASQTRTANVLDLNYYGITGKGLVAILDGIEDHPALEELYLKENHLNDYSVNELCRRLELSRQKSIKTIDVSGNPELTDSCGLALYALAARINSIVNIVVEGTGISGKTQGMLTQITKKNSARIVNK